MAICVQLHQSTMNLSTTQRNCIRCLRKHPNGVGVSDLGKKSGLLQDGNTHTGFITQELKGLPQLHALRHKSITLPNGTIRKGRVKKWYTKKHWDRLQTVNQKRSKLSRLLQLELF